MDSLFYLFAFLGLISGFCVISAHNAVHSVFFLILTFCLSSCVLFLLTIDFLSIIFIVVYVGAIAVLFLFVVMMLNIRLSHTNESVIGFLPLALLLGLVFVSEIYFVLTIGGNSILASYDISLSYLLSEESGIRVFSSVIYTHYWPMFIISGLILLIAMIGTISLTLYHSLNVRRQSIYKQVGRTVEESIVFFKHNTN